MIADSIRSVLLRILPRRRRQLHRYRLGWLSERIERFVRSGSQPIRLRLHGFSAWINPANPYLNIMAENPDFNRPLTTLIRLLSRRANRPLIAIDVGASLGNTALLLFESIGIAGIEELHCIEGDGEFFALLERNTKTMVNVHRHQAMLARDIGFARALVHHHPGTAGASGDARVPATTIDALLFDRIARCDLLKIDIDGSDGEALAGSRQLLQRDQPCVIFEWHPALIRKANNDPLVAFSTLREVGYKQFLWYKNTGQFSHFSVGISEELERWVTYLLAMQPYGDPHFDVIALPQSHRDMDLPLSTMTVPA